MLQRAETLHHQSRSRLRHLFTPKGLLSSTETRILPQERWQKNLRDTILCFALLTGLLAAPAAAQEGIKSRDVNYWRNLCDLQAKAEKYQEALKSCEQGLSLRRGRRDRKLWTLYSSVQLQLKQYPEAIASASQALRRRRKNSLALTYQCIAYRELQQETQALERCDQALRIDRNWGDQSPAIAWRYRGLILNQDQQYEEAIAAFDQTLALAPENSQALLYKCEAQIKLKDYPNAIASCQAALDGNQQWGSENSALAWYYQGLIHKEEKQYKAATVAYDQAIAQDPNDYKTWTDQGWVFNQLNRNTEALTSYNRALELKPDHSRTLVGQCRLLNKLQQYEPAAEACQKSIQGDGIWWKWGVAQAWNQLSHSLASQGKYEEALAAANRAVGIAPQFATAWSDRSVILWGLERYQEALESNKKALARNPDPKNLLAARTWANQGRVLRNLERYEEAEIAYQKAFAIAPDEQKPDILTNLSVVQWYQDKLNLSLESAEKAIRLKPDMALAWQNRGLALASLGLYPEAQATYEYTLELDGKNADAWTGLGIVLTQQEQYDAAMIALEAALEINPNQPVAQQAIAALNEYQQQLSQ